MERIFVFQKIKQKMTTVTTVLIKHLSNWHKSMKREETRTELLFYFFKELQELWRESAVTFFLYSSSPCGWIWIENLNLVAGCMCTRIWSNLEKSNTGCTRNSAGGEFPSWVSRIQSVIYRASQTRLLLTMDNTNLSTKM